MALLFENFQLSKFILRYSYIQWLSGDDRRIIIKEKFYSFTLQDRHDLLSFIDYNLNITDVTSYRFVTKRISLSIGVVTRPQSQHLCTEIFNVIPRHLITHS